MTSLTITPDAVHVRLCAADKALGFLRDQTIPLDAIRAVTLVERPGDAIAGRRAPGLAIPGAHRVGTWRSKGRRTFVCIGGRGPVLCIDTDGTRFDRYVIAVADAAGIAARLRAAIV